MKTMYPFSAIVTANWISWCKISDAKPYYTITIMKFEMIKFSKT